METFLIALIIGLIFVIVKMIIDIYALLLKVGKDKDIIDQPNKFNDKYQFIKGLF